MESQANVMNILLAAPWFASLPVADRKFMLASCEHLRMRPGEMLFRQGDQPSGFYALLSGSIKMSTLSAEGREAILIFLEAATWFGEISLIDNLPRTHDATALTEVELLVLAPQVFSSLMQRNAFANAITRMLAKRIRLLYGIVEDAGLRSVRARVARRLLLLAEVANRQQDGHAVVPVTQEALAMMLGMTRQTLSKELRFFKQHGLIRLAYGKIEILSENKLSALCDKE